MKSKKLMCQKFDEVNEKTKNKKSFNFTLKIYRYVINHN